MTEIKTIKITGTARKQAEKPPDPRSWGHNALNPIKSQMEQAEKEHAMEADVAPMEPPTAAQAVHWSRILPAEEHLGGVSFSRCGGAQVQPIVSFPDSVNFLQPMSPHVAWQTHGAAHYVAASDYVAWLRDTVGDTVLADAIAPFAETDEAPGKQLAKIRPVIRVRLKQYLAAAPELTGQPTERGFRWG